MKKLFTLFFAAVLCAVSINVQAADIKGGTVVLLKPGTNWKQSNARFAVYFYGGDGESWVSMSKVDGETDLYYAIAPSGTRKNLIYCRMNPGAAANNWNNKWNQSADLTWSNSYSLFTVANSSWDGATTTWSEKKVASTGKLTASSTNVSENEAVTLTPALTSNTAINTIQSTTYSISPATGASMDGNTFTATAAGTYTVTATIKYRLNGYTSTSFESTTSATTTIIVTSVAETKHPVIVSYKYDGTDLQNSTTSNVGETTATPITAPAKIDGRYAFQSWALGTGVTTDDANTDNPISVKTLASGKYTLTANYEDTYTTIYFVNTKSWSSVNAYVWDSSDNAYKAWAGEAMTLTGDKAHGYDVYSYSFPAQYTNCIFNGNGQTENLVVKAGQCYDIASKTWYATLAEVPNPTPAVMETVYLINTGKWEKVYAYAWTTNNNGWPGQELTKNGEKVAEFDVYSFEAEQGQWANIIFNNNSGTQTGDLTWQAGKYYAPSTNKWYDDAAAAADDLAAPVVNYDYYMAGTLAGGWNEKQKGLEKEGDVYKTTFTGLAAGTYEFKITNGTWKEEWGFDKLDKTYTEIVSEGVDDEGNPNKNIKIVTTQAKNITVTFNPTALYPISIDGLGGTSIPTFDYYVVGDFNGWANPDPNNGMTLDGTVYKATVSLKAGENNLKVTNGTWANGTSKGYTDLGASYEEVTSGADGNIKITLAAAKDVVVLYNTTTGKITFENLTLYVAPLTYTVTVPAGTEKCYIVGAFAQSNWNTFLEMDKVTGEDNKFTITIAGAKESDGYKYTRGEGWEYVEVKETGEGIKDRTWKESDVVAKWADVITYVLMGVNGDWITGIALTKNPGNEDEYVLENQVVIKATDAVKVVTLTNGTASAWCGDVDSWSNATYTADADGNIVLEDGIYSFYFKKSANNIYINQTGYVRNVTNKYGTICLPYASASITGAHFYRVAGKETGKVYLESVDALEAGVPYIFEKTASQIKVVYTGEKETTAGTDNGLVGNFTNETVVPTGNYILYNNAFIPADGTTNKVNAYRAYLNLSAVEGGKPNKVAGRRYIGMDVQGENETTGFENIVAPEGQTIKAIVNGQLVIIRGGEMYNIQGQKL